MTIDKESRLDKFYKKFISKSVNDLITNSAEYEKYKDFDLKINFTLESVNRIIKKILKPTINYKTLYLDFEKRYLKDIKRFQG